MNPEQERQLREKVAAFFAGREFDRHFEELHTPPLIAWLVALIAPFTIIGIPAAKGAWRAILRGDLATKKLRRRYARLGDEGSIIFSYVVIANQMLKYQERVNAPALLVGSFNNSKDDEKIIGLHETLADLALLGDTDKKYPKTAKLLKDIDYAFMRRRRIPAELAGDAEIYAFDLRLLGEFLPTATLKIEAIPLLAEPGPKGLSCMIPSEIVFEVLDMEKGEQTEDPEHDRGDQKASTLWQFSHAFVSDSLQNHRKGFAAALMGPKGSVALKKVIDGIAKDAGESLDTSSIQVENMRHDDFLVSLITFPPPARKGEAYYGMVVWGPENNWNKVDFEKVSYRYFLLEKRDEHVEGHMTSIVDFSHQEYIDCHVGCPVFPPEFVDKVLSTILKLDTDPGRKTKAPSKMSGCRILAMMVSLIALSVIGFLGYQTYSVFQSLEQTSRILKPGQAEFEAAERSIGRHAEKASFGNTEQAEVLAARYSKRLGALRSKLFSKGESSTFSLTDGLFLTHCNLVEGKCVFLVHVPQFRKYTNEAQRSLAKLAWVSANEILKKEGFPPSTELAIGLKGLINYGAIYQGKLDGEGSAMSGVTLQSKGFSDRHLFHSFFVGESKTAGETKALPSKPVAGNQSTRRKISATENPFRELLTRVEFNAQGIETGKFVERSFYQAAKTNYPTTGIHFQTVPPDSREARAGIKQGSVMYQRGDHKFWGGYVSLINLKEPYTAHLIDPDGEEQTVELEPGPFEADYTDVYRLDLAYLRNEIGKRNVKWDSLMVGAILYQSTNPAFSETALAQAIKGGYKEDALTDILQVRFKTISEQGPEKAMESFFSRFEGKKIPWIYLPSLHNALVVTGRMDFMRTIAQQAGDNCVFTESVVEQFSEWSNGQSKLPQESLLDRAKAQRGQSIADTFTSVQVRGEERLPGFELDEAIEIDVPAGDYKHFRFDAEKIPNNIHYHISAKARVTGIVKGWQPLARIYFTNLFTKQHPVPVAPRFKKRGPPYFQQFLHLSFISTFSYTVVETSGNGLPGLMLERQHRVSLPFVKDPVLSASFQKEFKNREQSLTAEPRTVEIDLIRYKNEVGIFVDGVCYLHLPTNPKPTQHISIDMHYVGMQFSIEKQQVWELRD